MRKNSILATVIAVLAPVVLSACSPAYNWREYSSPDAPYRVMFPDKPATYTREVDLNGMKVDMTMTAAQVNGAMFAVGTAQAPDPAAARAALESMETALVRNIGGRVSSQKSAVAASAADGQTMQASSRDVVADGAAKGVPMRLIGHFEARGNRFYQVIVMGPAKELTPEQTEQFMSSFRLQ